MLMLSRRVVHRLRTAAGKAIYAKRKSTVETVFDVIKGGARVSAISPSRVGFIARRMESGVYGMEPEANIRIGRLKNKQGNIYTERLLSHKREIEKA
jgi:hypothetical protein